LQNHSARSAHWPYSVVQSAKVELIIKGARPHGSNAAARARDEVIEWMALRYWHLADIG